MTRRRITQRLMMFSLLLLLLLPLLLPAAPPARAARPAASQPQRPAATRPARPATTQAADEASPELEAALTRLREVLPEDAVDGKREPTDREKMAFQFMMELGAATNGLNHHTPEEYRREEADTDKQLDEQFAKLRAAHAHASPDARAELDTVERLTREQAHLLDLLHRPSTFPTERASELDLARRIDRIPGVLDRAESLARDSKYHAKRLELLLDIDDLRAKAAAAGGGEEAAAAKRRLEAQTALLAATDAQYKAQVAADELKARSAGHK